ncbi:MAG: DUF2953 domain-containing protein [Oscillospiraceae bacterium]
MMILAIVLLTLLALLLLPVCLHIRYDGSLSIASTWLWLRYPLLPHPAKQKSTSVSTAAPSAKAPLKMPGLKESMHLLLDLLPGCFKPIRLLLRRTTLAAVEVTVRVAKGDAAQTAIAFGHVNATVMMAIAALDRVFTLRVRHIDIIPDFVADQGCIDASLEVRLIPMAALVAAFAIACHMVVTLLKTPPHKKKPNAPMEGEHPHGKQASHQ